jgi:hypothetical protein
MASKLPVCHDVISRGKYQLSDISACMGVLALGLNGRLIVQSLGYIVWSSYQ